MATKATRLRERSSAPAALKRFIKAIEPWYDWGTDSTLWRIDAVERDFSDESCSDAGRYFQLQWLGFSLEIIVGRTPPKITPEEVASRKRYRAAQAARS